MDPSQNIPDQYLSNFDRMLVVRTYIYSIHVNLLNVNCPFHVKDIIRLHKNAMKLKYLKNCT